MVDFPDNFTPDLINLKKTEQEEEKSELVMSGGKLVRESVKVEEEMKRESPKLNIRERVKEIDGAKSGRPKVFLAKDGILKPPPIISPVRDGSIITQEPPLELPPLPLPNLNALGSNIVKEEERGDWTEGIKNKNRIEELERAPSLPPSFPPMKSKGPPLGVIGLSLGRENLNIYTSGILPLHTMSQFSNISPIAKHSLMFTHPFYRIFSGNQTGISNSGVEVIETKENTSKYKNKKEIEEVIDNIHNIHNIHNKHNKHNKHHKHHEDHEDHKHQKHNTYEEELPITIYMVGYAFLEHLLQREYIFFQDILEQRLRSYSTLSHEENIIHTDIFKGVDNRFLDQERRSALIYILNQYKKEGLNPKYTSHIHIQQSDSYFGQLVNQKDSWKQAILIFIKSIVAYTQENKMKSYIPVVNQNYTELTDENWQDITEVFHMKIVLYFPSSPNGPLLHKKVFSPLKGGRIFERGLRFLFGRETYITLYRKPIVKKLLGKKRYSYLMNPEQPDTIPIMPTLLKQYIYNYKQSKAHLFEEITRNTPQPTLEETQLIRTSLHNSLTYISSSNEGIESLLDIINKYIHINPVSKFDVQKVLKCLSLAIDGFIPTEYEMGDVLKVSIDNVKKKIGIINDGEEGLEKMQNIFMKGLREKTDIDLNMHQTSTKNVNAPDINQPVKIETVIQIHESKKENEPLPSKIFPNSSPSQHLLFKTPSIMSNKLHSSQGEIGHKVGVPIQGEIWRKELGVRVAESNSEGIPERIGSMAPMAPPPSSHANPMIMGNRPPVGDEIYTYVRNPLPFTTPTLPTQWAVHPLATQNNLPSTPLPLTSPIIPLNCTNCGIDQSKRRIFVRLSNCGNQCNLTHCTNCLILKVQKQNSSNSVCPGCGAEINQLDIEEITRTFEAAKGKYILVENVNIRHNKNMITSEIGGENIIREKEVNVEDVVNREERRYRERPHIYNNSNNNKSKPPLCPPSVNSGEHLSMESTQAIQCVENIHKGNTSNCCFVGHQRMYTTNTPAALRLINLGCGCGFLSCFLCLNLYIQRNINVTNMMLCCPRCNGIIPNPGNLLNPTIGGFYS